MSAAAQSKRVRLDVGGTLFSTSISTLTTDPDSMLAAMFSGRHDITREDDGTVFIDRDGSHFRYILNYLRDSTVSLPDSMQTQRELRAEAQYFQIQGLVDVIDSELRGRDMGIECYSFMMHFYNFCSDFSRDCSNVYDYSSDIDSDSDSNVSPLGHLLSITSDDRWQIGNNRCDVKGEVTFNKADETMVFRLRSSYGRNSKFYPVGTIMANNDMTTIVNGCRLHVKVTGVSQERGDYERQWVMGQGEVSTRMTAEDDEWFPFQEICKVSCKEITEKRPWLLAGKDSLFLKVDITVLYDF